MKEAAETAYEEADSFMGDLAEAVAEEVDEKNFEIGELPAEVAWSSYVGSRFKWVDDPKLMKRLTYCKHSSLRSPAVYIVSVSRPNHVDCLRCGARRRNRALSASVIPCDMCNQTDENGFHEVMLQAGAFVITANLCPGCQQEQDRSVEILTEQYNELMKEQEDAQDD